jgi:hypothetical protein
MFSPRPATVTLFEEASGLDATMAAAAMTGAPAAAVPELTTGRAGLMRVVSPAPDQQLLLEGLNGDCLDKLRFRAAVYRCPLAVGSLL